MRVLIVSPHFDDAPLSLGQSLLDGALAGHEVIVGIVFGRTNWVRWMHPTRRRAPLAGAIRRAEEWLASRRFGYRLRIGALEEVVLRLDTTDTKRYLDPDFEPSSDPVLVDVRAVLADWARDADLVLAPLGIGDHRDHRLCAAAAADLDAPVAFYEDRPYVAFVDDEAVAARAAEIDPALEARPASGPITDRKRRKLWYPSQFSSFFVESFELDLARSRPEVVWARPTAAWPPTTFPAAQ